MIDRPILFSGPMVLAILAGRKTQTRRVIPQKLLDQMPRGGWESEAEWRLALAAKCRYGQPGDWLWVRETFSACACNVCRSAWPKQGPHGVSYKAGYSGPSGIVWRPSIHTPRWASRITLEVVGVRVERVQEISVDDCAAEGVPSSCPQHLRPDYACLWDMINAARGFGWDKNPWVWVVEFRRADPT